MIQESIIGRESTILCQNDAIACALVAAWTEHNHGSLWPQVWTVRCCPSMNLKTNQWSQAALNGRTSSIFSSLPAWSCSMWLPFTALQFWHPNEDPIEMGLVLWAESEISWRPPPLKSHPTLWPLRTKKRLPHGTIPLHVLCKVLKQTHIHKCTAPFLDTLTTQVKGRGRSI